MNQNNPIQNSRTNSSSNPKANSANSSPNSKANSSSNFKANQTNSRTVTTNYLDPNLPIPFQNHHLLLPLQSLLPKLLQQRVLLQLSPQPQLPLQSPPLLLHPLLPQTNIPQPLNPYQPNSTHPKR